ncbi:hypothetical protein M9H77_25755 [Catharanthus roseus]|uniref:Uncharacterized protein n=1 Tax=Catharanthus roseus TaxID=4058 RepID=A0ACC0A934_CATRO|nr:hypothetical protein M9H77_25755 [Catharanthus roseus]
MERYSEQKKDSPKTLTKKKKKKKRKKENDRRTCSQQNRNRKKKRTLPRSRDPLSSSFLFLPLDSAGAATVVTRRDGDRRQVTVAARRDAKQDTETVAGGAAQAAGFQTSVPAVLQTLKKKKLILDFVFWSCSSVISRFCSRFSALIENCNAYPVRDGQSFLVSDGMLTLKYSPAIFTERLESIEFPKFNRNAVVK